MSGDRFRATTDLIANLTTFPQVRLRAEILDVFRIGPSPGTHMQSFLHRRGTELLDALAGRVWTVDRLVWTVRTCSRHIAGQPRR